MAVDKKQLRILGYAVMAILILNLIVFALGLIGDILFWVIIVFGALFAYKVVPKMKGK